MSVPDQYGLMAEGKENVVGATPFRQHLPANVVQPKRAEVEQVHREPLQSLEGPFQTLRLWNQLVKTGFFELAQVRT
jgi:hypothetical protein